MGNSAPIAIVSYETTIQNTETKMNESYIKSAVKAAVVCGIISSCIAFLFVLYATIFGSFKVERLSVGPLLIFDVVVLALLTVGLSIRSRLCAIAMVVYGAISKYIQIRDGIVDAYSLTIGFVVLYFYVEAARAIFAHHQHIRAEVFKRQIEAAVDAKIGQIASHPNG